MRTLPLLFVLGALSACQSSWDIEDLDGDGFTLLEGDCDDARADVNPEGVETCDGIDNDCDGTADGEGADGAVRWMPDVDGDGYGDAELATISCDPPADSVTQDGDCDDSNEDKAPGLDEICDGVDNDCSGVIDDDPVDGDAYYEDRDRDGFGDAGRLLRGCTQPANTTSLEDATDCDDDVATAFPGSTATETPNDGVDQDCDGIDACTDLTCDGLPDLVIANHRTGSVYDQPVWIFASGLGGTLPEVATLELAANSVVALEIADLDDDGYQDLVWISGQRDGADAVTIAYGGAGGFPESKRQELPGHTPRDLDLVDVDADGWLDLIITNYQDDGGFSTDSTVFWGGDAGYSTGASTSLPTTGGSAAVVADLDVDGHSDVVFCNEQTGIQPSPYFAFSTVYWGGTDRLSAARNTPIQVTGCRDVVAADLDDDGLPDLAFAQWRTKGGALTSSKVVFNDGARFAVPTTATLATSAAASVSVGDVDGDDRPDLLFGVDSSVDEDWVRPFSVHLNGPTGFGTGRAPLQLDAADVRYPALADLDDDGDLDLLAPAFGTVDGAVQTDPLAVWRNTFLQGGGLLESEIDVGGALRTGATDADGDGDVDILITNAGAGVAGKIYASVYYGEGGLFSTARRWRVETRRVVAPMRMVGRWNLPE